MGENFLDSANIQKGIGAEFLNALGLGGRFVEFSYELLV